MILTEIITIREFLLSIARTPMTFSQQDFYFKVCEIIYNEQKRLEADLPMEHHN